MFDSLLSSKQPRHCYNAARAPRSIYVIPCTPRNGTIDAEGWDVNELGLLDGLLSHGLHLRNVLVYGILLSKHPSNGLLDNSLLQAPRLGDGPFDVGL